MALKFRRGTTAQQSGSLAFGEPYVNTTLGTLVVGGATGDIVLSSAGTGSTGTFGAISGSGLDITGNANIAGNVTVGGKLTIGDATSDTVNVVASLSSSLIPQTTNAFDLGSETKIWRDLYISTGSIKIVNPGTNTVVGTISSNADGTQTFNTLIRANGGLFISNSTQVSGTGGLGIGAYGDRLMLGTSGSAGAGQQSLIFTTDANNSYTFPNATGTIALTSDLTSTNTAVSSINSFTGSQLTQNTALATITGSLISTASNHEQRIAANEAVSSSYARTNSTNTFNGNQIVSGSMTVTQDLVVLGSSSIQNITSSNLVIGAAFVTLNANSPASRFAGLVINDSGSAGGSGSIFYDAVQDEVIFVHKGNGTNVTSSHFIMGPETIDNLGNETYLTNNRLPKGTGKEHIVDSQIGDDGTTVSIPGNLDLTGSMKAPQLTAIATITGSLILSASADRVSITNINVATASLQTTSASVNTSVSNLNSHSASVLTRLTEIGVVTGSLISSASTDAGRFATLATYTGSVNTSISNINVATASLQTTSASVNTSISNLNTTTGSLNTSVSNLNTFTASMSTTSNVRFGSLGIGMNASGTSGRIDAANDIVAFSTSDIRFKENITPIPNAIDKIRKISGNTYDWKSELKDVHGYEGNDVGVIAQEIEEVLPQLVQNRDNGYKAVKYDKLVALLIEGIKEQQQHIDNLTIQVEELKKQKGL